MNNEESESLPVKSPREWVAKSPLWDLIEDLERGRMDQYRRAWFDCHRCGNRWSQYTNDERPVSCNRCQSNDVEEADVPNEFCYVVDRGGPTLHTIHEIDGDRVIAHCGDERHRLGPRMMDIGAERSELEYERLCGGCSMQETSEPPNVVGEDERT